MTKTILPASGSATRRAWITILAAAVLCAFSAHSRTITTADKVVYEVLSETAHTVRVAAENSSIHRSNAVAITIPETITDTDGTEFTVASFAQSAFYNTAITSVEIRAEVKEIPSHCFRNCPNLQTAKIPASVTTIGFYAFHNCPVLKFPELSENVTKIENNAFYECANLRRVVLPSVTYIGSSAFSRSTMDELVLSESADEISIYSQAFYMVSGLKSVKFPAGVTSIPRECFRSASDLEVVDFSASDSGDLTIAMQAFLDCRKLHTVTFPKKIKSTAEESFRNCAITSLDIPEAESLDGFRDNKIASVTWPAVAPGSMADNLFASNQIAELTLPAWMTEVPYGLFRDNTPLKKVTFAAGTTRVGTYAFYGCKNLSDVTLPTTLKTISNQAFTECAMTSIDLPEGLDSIGAAAFSSCTKITAVKIPKSCRYIGNSAFSRCPLTEIDLPEPDNASFPPIEFGSYVFSNAKVTTFRFPLWLTKVPAAFLNRAPLTSVEFAPGTTEIGANAFEYCTELKIGTFPESITTFGPYSFSHCGTGLPKGEYFATIVIGGGLEINNNAFEYANIETVRFADCDYLLGSNIFNQVTTVSKIEFPECMTEIPAGICRSWKNLTEVVWPPVVKKIGNNAFSGCEKLIFGTDADGGGNVLNLSKYPFDKLEEIGADAFSSNTITEIIWPENGENLKLNKGIFNSNKKLTSVHIPAWMDSIPERMFTSCWALADVVWDESPRESLVIGGQAFRGCALPVITWPDVSTELGEESFAANHKATEIVWPESAATLAGPGVFASCSKISAPCEVPEYVTTLPSQTFQGCSSLPHFTLHGGITEFGSNAFYQCSSLEWVEAESAVDQLPYRMFGNCTRLGRISFSHPVDHIGKEVFSGCESLADIQFPQGSTVRRIEQRAFLNCKSLPGFPDVLTSDSRVEHEAFANCINIPSMKVPSYCDAAYKGDSSLQSVTFLTRPDGIFWVGYNAFEGAPLLGVSYLEGNVKELRNRQTDTDNRTEKGILMVPRDYKWQLMEKGYGRLWDIREVRDPQFTVYGDLHSEFTPGDTHNHYKATLRWEVLESDLNPSGPTVFHLHRDGAEVARIEIGTAIVVDEVNDGNINRVGLTNKYPVKVTDPAGNNIPYGDMYGDFSYEQSENNYVLVYNNMHTSLYFDAEQSRRLGLNERMGTRSWFLYVDEFDSPDLNGNHVPDHYTYTVTMDGYEYSEPVNNPDYAAGSDGKLWHAEARTQPSVHSEPCVVHASMAVPSITYTGIYTREEIEADTEGQLPLSVSVTDAGNGSVTLHYALANPDHVKHTISSGSSTTKTAVIDHITSYEIPSPTYPTADNEWTTIKIGSDQSKASGKMIVPADKQPREGSSFQIVTHTNGRGTFGSRIVTIKGIPTLSMTSDVMELIHDHGHDNVVRQTLHLKPDASRMGYNVLPSEGRYTYGIWRTLTYTDYSNPVMPLSAESGSEHLVDHNASPIEHSWACDACRDEQHLADWLYTDHFTMPFYDVESWKTVRAKYRARVYVADTADPSRYMIAEATTVQDALTGVEGLTPDGGADDESQARYFDLQGRPVAQPRDGQVVIRTTPAGSRTVHYHSR